MDKEALRLRISYLHDDMLTKFCEETQKLIDRGEATPDEVYEAVNSYGADDVVDAWEEWWAEDQAYDR